MQAYTMESDITVERVEPATEATTVHHVDQLSDRERDCLRRLARDGQAGGVDLRTAVTLAEYDVIKATDYLRVVCPDATTPCNVGANS